MIFSRRDFLKHSAAVAAGFGGLQTLSAYQSDKNALLTKGAYGGCYGRINLVVAH